jgi:hypothetical protein
LSTSATPRASDRIGIERDIDAGGHIGQIERQTGTHDDGVGAFLAGRAHIVGVGAHGLHDVHGDHAVAAGELARSGDLAAERDQVRACERFVRVIFAAFIGEVGVMMAQVDARDGAERAFARDTAREPVSRNADAHAALHDRQQLTPADDERRERMSRKHGDPLCVVDDKTTMVARRPQITLRLINEKCGVL